MRRVHKKIHEPICRPRSLPAPDDLCTYAWEEDWFASWYTKKHDLNKLRHQEKENIDDDGMDTRTQGTFLSRLTTKTSRTSKTRKSKYSTHLDSPDALYEEKRAKAKADRLEKPEIGTLHTLRYKLGERTTRVHYAYTSMLRKSRWKKKYMSKISLSN